MQSISVSGLSTTLSFFFSGLIPDFRGHAGYANVLVCVKLNFFYHRLSSLGRETAKMIEVENIPGDKNDGLRVLNPWLCLSIPFPVSPNLTLFSLCAVGRVTPTFVQ